MTIGAVVIYESLASISMVIDVSSWIVTESAIAVISGVILLASMFWSSAI